MSVASKSQQPRSGAGGGEGGRSSAAEVADQERQQKRLNQAEAEAKARVGSGEGSGAKTGISSAGQTATAQIMQWCWKFYIASFTLTSIYIFLHILLRYIFHFNVFCRADQGSPLAGFGGGSLTKGASSAAPSGTQFSQVLSGSRSAGEWAQEKKQELDAGIAEKIWIALGVVSIAPLVAVVGVVIALADAVEHPGRYALCSAKYIGIEAVTVTLSNGRETFLKCVLAGEFK